MILSESPFYAGIAVDDIAAAQRFYRDTLGLAVAPAEGNPLLLQLTGPGDRAILIYQRPNHVPPQHTVLNFPVPDIEAAVDELTAAGVTFEQYADGPIATDAKGIAHPGPWQAWFTDPAGNILSVLQ